MSAYFFCFYLVVSFADTQHSIRNMFDLGSISLPRKECLDAWVLDDSVGGGSKPFSIRGGSVAGGAMRTFRKDETNIVLNNLKTSRSLCLLCILCG